MSQEPTTTPHWLGRAGGAKTALLAAAVAWAYALPEAAAHGISEDTRETMTAGGIIDYIWLGAEHMVTGYDHLLFLFGVIFFLKGFKDVVRFITAFTLGHCITLLGATLAGITANAYIIDAVIALSVIYKGFENLDGFKKHLKIDAPNLLVMVFIFGLIHGLGLSTRLQELPLGDEGLVSRILAFNVGVELGQIAALSLMLGFFAAWRSSKVFERFDRIANIALVIAGAGLFVLQIQGYLGDHGHHDHPSEEPAHHHSAEAAESPAPVTQPIAPVEETKAKTKTKAKAKAKAKAHSHGSGKPHSHGKKKKKKKAHSHGKTHSHGSGKPHKH